MTLFGNGSQRNASPPFVDNYCFVPYRPHECGFSLISKQVPNFRPVKLVVTGSECQLCNIARGGT